VFNKNSQSFFCKPGLEKVARVTAADGIPIPNYMGKQIDFIYQHYRKFIVLFQR
jgi:hypothetical protein